MAEDRGGAFRVAAWTPALILVYFAAHALFRAGISPYLERDEAEFIGQTGFRLGFENSHPPLYNWLLTLALVLTAGKWASALAIVKNGLLAGTYLLGFDMLRRLTGRTAAGLVLVAAFLLLPQIVWKSQITLAHSVLVLFGTVATLHALVICMRNGTAAGFVWLGAALSVALLSKYNFFFTLAALGAAIFWVPDVRARIVQSRLWLSGLVAVLLTGPHFAWAVMHWQSTTKRLGKLDTETVASALPIDVPGLGIDGALSVLTGSAVSLALLVAVIAAAARWSRLRGEVSVADPPDVQPFARFLLISGIVGLLGLAIFALLGDYHGIQERYLTPVLLPFVVWLCLRSRVSARPGATKIVASAGAITALIASVLLIGSVLLGRDQLAFPYRAIAEKLGPLNGATAVFSRQEKYAANLSLLLPGLEIWRGGTGPDRVLVLLPKGEPLSAPGGEPLPFERLYQPAGQPIEITAAYENWSGAAATILAVTYQRR